MKKQAVPWASRLDKQGRINPTRGWKLTPHIYKVDVRQQSEHLCEVRGVRFDRESNNMLISNTEQPGSAAPWC